MGSRILNSFLNKQILFFIVLTVFFIVLTFFFLLYSCSLLFLKKFDAFTLQSYEEIDHDFYKKLGFKVIEFNTGTIVFGIYIPIQWVNLENQIYVDVLNGSMFYVQLLPIHIKNLTLNICNNYIGMIDAKFKDINLYKNAEIVTQGIRKFSNIDTCFVDHKIEILNKLYYIRQINYPLLYFNVFFFIKINVDEYHDDYEQILNFIANSLFKLR